METQLRITAWQQIRPWLRYAKRILEIFAQPLFHLTGAKAHSFGYYWHKQQSIRREIDTGKFELVEGYGLRVDERIVEFPWLISRLPDVPGKLLDAGSALNHAFLLNHRVLQNKDITVSTLAPESTSYWRRGISYVYEDLRYSRFRDGYFDWIACVSTLEHVGLDNTLLYTSDGSKKETEKSGMLIFVRELRRVLRSGGKLYLTVPFGSHQNFGWFQVFNAEMVELLASEFQPAHRIDNYFKYTSRGWAVSRPEELCDTDYFDVQTSSTRTAPDGAAGARGLICLEWTT